MGYQELNGNGNLNVDSCCSKAVTLKSLLNIKLNYSLSRALKNGSSYKTLMHDVKKKKALPYI